MSWLHAVLDLPRDDPRSAAAVSFWERVVGWPLGTPAPHRPELADFVPPDGQPSLHRQLVDAPAGVHLDLEVDDVDAQADRLAGLGAGAVSRTDDRRALLSPGGLPFCLVPVVPGAVVPGPTTVGGPEGHRVRLVQVCIDLPEDRVQAELGFWRAALGGLGDGGRWGRSDSPEFLVKWHDASGPDETGSPLQLLFQRLGEATGPVRAHLDLGTDDLDAEAGRLRRLGALPLHDGDGFRAFTDPAGLAFCATANPPDVIAPRPIGPPADGWD